MGRLDFTVSGLDFADLPQFGPDSLFARLAGGGAKEMGYPALGPGDASHTSGSDLRDWAAAAEAVAAQNPTLRRPDQWTRYVVAGQQAGLLTGPMYTFLKAVSAISLARRLAKESGSPVLPLFWIASEDHDVLEVNRVTVNGRRFVHGYQGELARGKVPQVADIDITEAREPLLGLLRETLPETEFTPWVTDIVASADFSSYATCFRDIMDRGVFDWPELRLIEPGPLRRLTSPVLALAVERWEAVNAALDAGAVMLRKAGIDPPLGSATVFEITPEGRRAVEIASGQARLAAGEIPLGRLAAEIRRRPDEFSPGAALRPVLQDAVLPVVATLGGPSELAYLWQIIPVYEALGVTPSRCAPRISATFVEEKVMRAARKAGLGPERLFEAGRLLGTYDTEADRDPAIDNIEERAAGLLGEIDRAAGEFLPPGTPPRWLRRSASTIRSAVDRLAAQLHEEKRKAAGLDRSRLEKIASALLPGGIPQERSANIVEFLNLHGPEFVRLSVEALDPASGRHQVVLVSTVRE